MELHGNCQLAKVSGRADESLRQPCYQNSQLLRMLTTLAVLQAATAPAPTAPRAASPSHVGQTAASPAQLGPHRPAAPPPASPARLGWCRPAGPQLAPPCAPATPSCKAPPPACHAPLARHRSPAPLMRLSASPTPVRPTSSRRLVSPAWMAQILGAYPHATPTPRSWGVSYGKTSATLPHAPPLPASPSKWP